MLFNLPSLQTHNAARMPLTHVYQQLPYVRDLLKSMLASSLFYPQSTSPFLKSVPVNLPLRVNGFACYKSNHGSEKYFRALNRIL